MIAKIEKHEAIEQMEEVLSLCDGVMVARGDLGVELPAEDVPILQKQFPEIVDFYLPPEGCSYRMAIVTMKKQYPGHAKRIMMGVWSFLRQFMYTKFVIVTDEDVGLRQFIVLSIMAVCVTA